MKLKAIVIIVGVIAASTTPLFAQTLTISLALPEEHPVFKRVQKLVDEIITHSGHDIKARIVYTPNNRSVILLEKGYSDGDIGRSKIVYADRPYAVVVPEAVLATTYYAFSKQKIVIQGWGSLRPFNVVVERGDQIAIFLLRRETKSLEIAGNDEAALKMVLKGHADVYVGDIVSALPVCRQIKCEQQGIKIQQPPVADVPLYLFLHKNHQYLVNDFTTAIKLMKKQGRIKAILSGEL